MEKLSCPRCGSENNYDHSFCSNCDYPLRHSHRKKRFSFINMLLFFFIALVVIASSTLAYIEFKHPDYGLKKRLSISLDVLFQKDWLDKQNKMKSSFKQHKNNMKKFSETLGIVKKKMKRAEQVIEKYKNRIKELEKSK